jgi:hypothetical protein
MKDRLIDLDLLKLAFLERRWISILLAILDFVLPEVIVKTSFVP